MWGIRIQNIREEKGKRKIKRKKHSNFSSPLKKLVTYPRSPQMERYQLTNRALILDVIA